MKMMIREKDRYGCPCSFSFPFSFSFAYGFFFPLLYHDDHESSPQHKYHHHHQKAARRSNSTASHSHANEDSYPPPILHRALDIRPFSRANRPTPHMISVMIDEVVAVERAQSRGGDGSGGRGVRGGGIDIGAMPSSFL